MLFHQGQSALREALVEMEAVTPNWQRTLCMKVMPQMKMAEYEVSLMLKASTGFFPVIEAGGETMEGETSLYVLPGLKFKLAKGKFLGVGTQVVLTSMHDFDTRVLLQLDMDW